MNEIQLEQFIKENKSKKLFISANAGEIDDVLKSFVYKSKNPIIDFESTTIDDLAKRVFIAFNSEKNYILLNNDEVGIILFTFLSRVSESQEGDIYHLIPKESLTLSTCKMVLNTINQVRLGQILKQTKLDALINDFENFLLSKNYYDRALLLKTTNQILDNQESDNIISALGYGNDVSIGLFASIIDKLSFQEQNFIDNLGKIYYNQLTIVNYYDENIKPKVNKINAYGFYNEASFIVDTIKKENININDVSVFVSETKYNSLLKAVFESVGIKYHFSYGNNANEDSMFAFVISLLHFYQSHLSIEYLYELYRNPSLMDEYKCLSQISELRSDKSHIIHQLYSSKRKDKTSGELVDKWNEKQKTFMLDVLSIYESTANTSSIYHCVIDLLDKYIKPQYRINAKASLVEKERFFSFIDDSKQTFEEKIKFIIDSLEGTTISKEKNKSDSYIEINKLRNASFLSRKYNFFIGLSAKQFEVKEIESPLFSDKELKECLSDLYFIDFATDKNQRLIDGVKKLLSTNKDSINYFIRSSYDSIEFKGLAPSILFSIYDGEEIEAINHYNDEILTRKKAINLEDYIIDEITSSRLDKINDYSPSAIETIITCPLRYIYEQKYDAVELDEYTGDWLKGGDYGTFAHRVLELYFKKRECSSSLDKDHLKDCFNKAKEETIENIPFDNPNKIDYDSNLVKQTVINYLDRYYKARDLNEPYFVIGCEYKFSDVEIEGIKFHGTVDRIDGFVDMNKKLHLRLIDYKTTADNAFDDKKKSHMLVQAVIYPFAAIKYCNENKEEIARIIGNYDSIEIENIPFVYERIKTNNITKIETSENEQIKQNIVQSVADLHKLLKNSTKACFDSIYKVEIDKESDNNHGRCGYCKYSSCCYFKMTYGENMIWKK